MKLLRAFYDLKVSPATYDIISFLFLADMWRLKSELDAIDLYIVANDGPDAFREDQIDESKNQKQWILDHVMLRSDVVLPACRRTIFVPDRVEAKELAQNTKHIFPDDYSVENPKPKYVTTEIIHLGLQGCPYTNFEATPEAMGRMASWIGVRSNGRKVITITLREMSRQPGRNSNVPAWIEFARSLDHEKYLPVILRDTNTIFQPIPLIYQDITTCDIASLNMELRAALYQHAYTNLIINNGPNGLLHLSSLTSYLQLKPEGTGANVSENYERKAGFGPDYHFLKMNSHQLISFQSDKLENIQSNFERLILNLELGNPIPARPWPAADVWLKRFARYGAFEDAERILKILLQQSAKSDQLNNDFNTTVENSAENLINENHLQDAKLGYDLLVHRVPNETSYALKRLVLLLRLNDFEEAIIELEHLESLGANFDGFQLIWGQCLLYLGRHGEALPHLEKHIIQNPDDPKALYNLAEALEAIGDHHREANVLERALTNTPIEERELKTNIEQALIVSHNRRLN